MDIIRQKAGRGGKTVTVVTGFVGIGLPEKEQLAKAMQKLFFDTVHGNTPEFSHWLTPVKAVATSRG